MTDKRFLGADYRLRLSGAGLAAVAAVAATPAWAAAAEPSFALPVISDPTDPSAGPTFQAITDGKTACAQDIGASNGGQLPGQCAFDSAAFGSRVDSHIASDAITVDTYAVAAGTIGGMWTADQLLGSGNRRFGSQGSLLVFGLKSSLFDNRLTISTESDWSQNRDIAFEGSSRTPQITDRQGHANSIKLDFKLLDSPKLKWSVSGSYSSVSDGYSTGPNFALFRYFALPGTRFDVSSKGRIGTVGLAASLQDYQTSFGETASKRVSVDVSGVTLTFIDRASSTHPNQQFALSDSQAQSTGLYADFDVSSIADKLLPRAGKLRVLMPVSVGVYLQSGQSSTVVSTLTQAYRRTSVETTASWQTPIGETDLDYMVQRRIGLVGMADRQDEYLQLSHSVRWKNWRFGGDAMFSSGSSEGTRGSADRSVSLGGSLAYYVADGPQLRLQIGQDMGASRLNDDSFASRERYSSITGSLDLSRYLQRQFDRPDLHLNLDYRRALSRDDSSFSLFGDAVERLMDGYDRSGFLVSFGMKL